jgi:NRPS condensation-like uncharacterized protein
MLQWDEVHPYSAVHVVQMGGALDATRLRSSINRTLEKHGLTRLTLDSGKCAFQYESGTADCEIRTVSGVEARSALVAEMERQLNLRFDHTRPFCPFRFLVAQEGASFFLGLVYLHPAADAESVVCLLKDIITCYLEEGAGQGIGSLELYPDRGAYALWRHPMVVARRFLALPAQVRNLRQSYRARYADADNLANGFVLFSVAPEDLRSLVAAAKTWGVTINDLFIALLLKSLSPCAAGRAQERKRRKISIGCIVNLRKDLGVDGRRTFGLLLGSFTVTHEVPEGISLCNLVADIRDQTAPIKQHKLYLGTPLELGFARFMLRFFPPGRRKVFYAKHHPLWGGITNVNLNRLWEPAGGSLPLDYFRGVSTGPVTPLVLSVTTIGDRMNLGLSYRITVFSRTDIEGVQSRFLEHLEEARRDL